VYIYIYIRLNLSHHQVTFIDASDLQSLKAKSNLNKISLSEVPKEINYFHMIE